MESTLTELIWDLANLRLPGAYAITAHLNERTLVDICSTLADVLVKGPQPKLAEELMKHLSHIIGTLYPKRNQMIHSNWGHSGSSGKTSVLPIKARGKLKFGPRKDLSADDIVSIADEIIAANDKLCDFHDQLRQLIPTWRHLKKS